MCLYPRYIKNPKYLPNKKNGGRPPKCKDERIMYVPIGCGKCLECRKQKANEWKVRLNEELKHNTEHVNFYTLTFTPERLERLERESNTISEQATIAVRRFLERIRKITGKSTKHWIVSEIGQNNTERLHLHGIIWGNENIIKKAWEIEGICYPGYKVDEQTINYCVKYILKNDEKHNYVSKIYTSPGIGKGYKETGEFGQHTFKGKETKDYYRLNTGFKMRNPIYYRNMLYTEEEREKLWIHKIEQKKRYVLGTEFNIALDSELRAWSRAIKTGQEQSERNGYQKSNYYKINDYEKRIKRILEISNKSCIFATENEYFKLPGYDKSKIQLENIRLQKTETNVHLFQNLGHNGHNENGEKLNDGMGYGYSGNTIQKRNRLHRTHPNLETYRIEKTNNNILNNYENENYQNLSEIQEFKRMRERDKDRGYTVVNIDTGEIYTKSEYTKLKNQLKTISYDKKNRKGTRPDGSKYTWYETKRFVQKVGKDQLELFP